MPVEMLEARIKYLQNRLQPVGVAVRSDSPTWAAVEGVLARGDRRLGQVLAGIKKTTLPAWQQALETAHLTQSDYLGQRDKTEKLPWESINTGVSQAFFSWDLKRAVHNELTKACPPANCLMCQACDEAWAFRSDHLDTLGPNLGAYGDDFIPLQVD